MKWKHKGNSVWLTGCRQLHWNSMKLHWEFCFILIMLNFCFLPIKPSTSLSHAVSAPLTHKFLRRHIWSVSSTPLTKQPSSYQPTTSPSPPKSPDFSGRFNFSFHFPPMHSTPPPPPPRAFRLLGILSLKVHISHLQLIYVIFWMPMWVIFKTTYLV